ncbi:hypothetical protein [Frankia sp. CiP3]|uniref:Pepco domain-containing protein n=1 Tax=Frankia sp. CiP3 TaxID=2880971 RepID=UPI001EF6FEFE|nr:hypothetical protein [Frankia sp. CiP3]
MSDARVEVPTCTLPFLVADDEEDVGGGDKGIFRRRGGETSVRNIPVAVLRESLRHVVDGLRGVFDEIAEAGGRLPLKEAQISFEVTASGGVTVIGASSQVGATGAITLTFGE